MSSQRKIVILIGMTGNGKSKLVQEILKYSGDRERAATVKVGDGNLSETQHCSLYQSTVLLKEHSLRDVKSKNRVVPGPDILQEDVEEVEVSTGVSIDLEIIDTPGLSDSGNKKPDLDFMQEAKKNSDGDPTSGVVRMVQKDERHKISILKALSKVERVHAICFVLKSSEYSNSLQETIRALQGMFDLAFLNIPAINYHIIHTSVETGHRFTDFTKTRERDFTVIFPGLQATHHFMDNKPLLDDPTSCYFSKAALAEFFSSLAVAEGMDVKDLWYPKTEAHKYNDDQLRRGLLELEKSYESDISVLKANLKIKEEDKERKSNQLAHRKRELKQIDAEISRKDSGKLSRSNSGTFTAVSVWLGPYAEKKVSLTSRYPIANVYYAPPKNGTWSDKTADEHKATATLKSNSFYAQVEGTIRIESYRRDKYQAEIRELRENRLPLQSIVDAKTQEIAYLNGEIMALRFNIAQCEAIVDDLKKGRRAIAGQNHRLGADNFHVGNLAGTLQLFTTESLYAAASGYGIKTQIPKIKLSGKNLENEKEWTKPIDAIRLKNSDWRKAREVALAAIDADIIQKRKILVQLEPTCERVSQTREERSKCFEQVENAVFPPYDKENTEPQLAKVMTVTRTKSQHATESVRAILVRELEIIEHHGKALVSTYESVQEVCKEMEKTKKQWEIELESLKLWHVAAEQVAAMAQQPYLELGAFLVVKKALASRKPNPYIELCVEIWEALKAIGVV